MPKTVPVVSSGATRGSTGRLSQLRMEKFCHTLVRSHPLYMLHALLTTKLPSLFINKDHLKKLLQKNRKSSTKPPPHFYKSRGFFSVPLGDLPLYKTSQEPKKYRPFHTHRVCDLPNDQAIVILPQLGGCVGELGKSISTFLCSLQNGFLTKKH